MDGIFTLPYSEFEVINHLQKKFKKNDGFSIYIPASRQQKGIDFIMHNAITNKMVRFQVKASRTYVHEARVLRAGRIRKPPYRYYLWLNNFIEKYQKGNSDYYIIFGLYPVYDIKKNIKGRFWNSVTLCFSEAEMFRLLTRIKTKREQKTDKFFAFGFNSAKQIYVARGLKIDEEFSKNLLENKVGSLMHYLGST